MMPDDNLKPNPPNPSEMEKLLEIELMQKRAAWQQAKTRHGTWRALSFLFLFLVIATALVGIFIFLSSDRRAELKSGRTDQAQPSPTPLASPN